jgi:hypothetical protein
MEGDEMIMDALLLVSSELNDYVRQRLNSEDETLVYLSSITDGSGNSASPNDAITITLTNAEEECVNRAQQPTRVRHGDKYHFTEPEIRINLHVIISVRPSKNTDGSNSYTNALKRLSIVSEFFQGRRYFDQSAIGNPSISNKLERVIVNLHTSGFEQLSYIWGVHGGNYLPSLMYKLSLVIIQDDMTSREVPMVKEVGLEADGGGLI